ncbi:hypothetical protein QYE76_022832 [Lolium multiflorum]|uniref:Uncharacterized protein n=1 Tax=Lolium multiflorum TaxID=4521 RepID=A0AAD8VU55_LOLMU|nr:hypothetical protein QYE76_022832 [Lolium multiflorum]
MPKRQLLFSAVFGFRNPTKEIFSELDKINAQGLIFPRSFQKTEEHTKWPQAVTIGGAAARPARPMVWGPVPSNVALPPTYTLRRENPITESHDTEILPDAAAANPISGIQEIASGTLPERGIITGGLYITMPASGLMHFAHQFTRLDSENAQLRKAIKTLADQVLEANRLTADAQNENILLKDELKKLKKKMKDEQEARREAAIVADEK